MVSIGDRGQLGLQTLLAAFVVVIAVMAGIVVIDDFTTTTGVDADVTVTNESVDEVNFTNNRFEYTVDAFGEPDTDTIKDDELVFNNSTTKLVEGDDEDYQFVPSNGTLVVFNTANTSNGTTTMTITYNHTSRLGQSDDSVVSGFADMVSLIGPLLLIAIGVVIIGLIRRVQ